VIQTQATLSQKETIAPAWWRLTFSAPDLPPPQPGQFLLLRCADRLTCYLRRPFFPFPWLTAILACSSGPTPIQGWPGSPPASRAKQ